MYSAASRRLILLDLGMKSPAAEGFEAGLRGRVIGQDRALRALVSVYQVFRAGLSSSSRPITVMLFLGPTGSGKTRLVEAAAETLFGSPSALVKINCAEFQHSHEISKLIGSPPGYLGHRETQPMLTQQTLDGFHLDSDPFTFVLFDEIEKASDALWKLLLGILDKATLTLGDNRRVNFSQTMIFMTSNLGAREMATAMSGSMGFAPAQCNAMAGDDLDQKIYHTAMEEARRHFSPEFMNRIDKVVAFRSLKREELRKILDLELAAVTRRIEESLCADFSFNLSDAAKEFLLDEGTDCRFGARHLKRQIERYLVYPLATLTASGQVHTGDLIHIEVNDLRHNFEFFLDQDPVRMGQAAMQSVASRRQTNPDLAAA